MLVERNAGHTHARFPRPLSQVLSSKKRRGEGQDKVLDLITLTAVTTFSDVDVWKFSTKEKLATERAAVEKQD